MGTNIWRNLDHILSSGCVAGYFEVFWPFSALLDRAQWTCYSYISSLNIALSDIMPCDWSRTFLEITEELEFCQAWNLVWEVEYHNNYPSRLFSRKSSAKLKIKEKISYFVAFFNQV